MKWINHPLSPAVSLKELTIKLLFPKQVETTEHLPHQTTLGLGLQIPSFIYHSSLVSTNKSFCKGKMACSQTQRGHSPRLRSELGRGAAEKALLSVPASGSETLRPLSLEATKRVVEKPSFSRKPKICACHFVFIWHSSMAAILSSCRCLCLKEGS